MTKLTKGVPPSNEWMARLRAVIADLHALDRMPEGRGAQRHLQSVLHHARSALIAIEHRHEAAVAAGHQPWSMSEYRVGRPALKRPLRVLRISQIANNGRIKFYHAVPAGLIHALCGARPYKQSRWHDEEGEAVTCKRCLAAPGMRGS